MALRKPCCPQRRPTPPRLANHQDPARRGSERRRRKALVLVLVLVPVLVPPPKRQPSQSPLSAAHRLKLSPRSRLARRARVQVRCARVRLLRAVLIVPSAAVPKHAAIVRALKGHSDAVTDIAFSPNGKYIATGGRGGKVRVWSVASFSKATPRCYTVQLDFDSPVALAFSEDGCVRVAEAQSQCQ